MNDRLYIFILMPRRPPRSTPFPYTTLFRPAPLHDRLRRLLDDADNEIVRNIQKQKGIVLLPERVIAQPGTDRKSTRLNSSHANISYAVFCLKKNQYLMYSVLDLSNCYNCNT